MKSSCEESSPNEIGEQRNERGPGKAGEAKQLRKKRSVHEVDGRRERSLKTEVRKLQS